MSMKGLCILRLLIIPYFGISEVFAEDVIRGELIVYPREWKIPGTEPSGKILLAWEVSNVGEKMVRFRIRDLGKINLIDSNGKAINPTRLGVDSTKAFQIQDYPLIGSHETLYFPFAVSFLRQENKLFSLKIRSDHEGDEGWFFKDLKEGKYSIVAKYSTIGNSSHDGGFIWEQELRFLKPRVMENIWEGEIMSKPIDITITGQ